MGNRVFIDSNIKKFTDNRITSLPIELLTYVKLPITTKSEIMRQRIDTFGNKIFIDKDGNTAYGEYTYIAQDKCLDMSTIDMIIGEPGTLSDIFYADAIANRPLLENSNHYNVLAIDETTSLGLNVDDVLTADAVNLLEDSIFSKVIIDIMDCIVGGTYNSYCSYKVSLNPRETVIFNIEANVTLAIRLYNIPLDLDIYVNSIKISKNDIDSNLGIFHTMEAIDINIKLENNTTRSISVVNPLILFT